MNPVKLSTQLPNAHNNYTLNLFDLGYLSNSTLLQMKFIIQIKKLKIGKN